MNPFIVKLIRLQYAINSIEAADNGNPSDAASKKTQARQKLVYELMKNGRSDPQHSEYILNIFQDIRDKTGLDLTGREKLKSRKRILGVLECETYTNPAANVQRGLMDYLGYGGITWDELEKSAETKLQGKTDFYTKMSDNNTRIMINARNDSQEFVHLSLLEQYHTVEFLFDAGGFLHVECLEPNKFIVRKVNGIHLEEGDYIHSGSTIVKGNKLAFVKIIRQGDKISYVGNHPVRRITVSRLTNEQIMASWLPQ